MNQYYANQHFLTLFSLPFHFIWVFVCMYLVLLSLTCWCTYILAHGSQLVCIKLCLTLLPLSSSSCIWNLLSPLLGVCRSLPLWLCGFAMGFVSTNSKQRSLVENGYKCMFCHSFGRIRSKLGILAYFRQTGKLWCEMMWNLQSYPITTRLGLN